MAVNRERAMDNQMMKAVAEAERELAAQGWCARHLPCLCHMPCLRHLRRVPHLLLTKGSTRSVPIWCGGSARSAPESKTLARVARLSCAMESVCVCVSF